MGKGLKNTHYVPGPMPGALCVLLVSLMVFFEVDGILCDPLMKILTQSLTIVPRLARIWGWDREVSGPRLGSFTPAS